MKLQFDQLCKALNDDFLFKQGKLYTYTDEEGDVIWDQESESVDLNQLLEEGRTVYLHYVILEDSDEGFIYRSAEGKAYKTLEEDDPDYNEAGDLYVNEFCTYGISVKKTSRGLVATPACNFLNTTGPCYCHHPCLDSDVPAALVKDINAFLKKFIDL